MQMLVVTLFFLALSIGRTEPEQGVHEWITKVRHRRIRQCSRQGQTSSGVGPNSGACVSPLRFAKNSLSQLGLRRSADSALTDRRACSLPSSGVLRLRAHGQKCSPGWQGRRGPMMRTCAWRSRRQGQKEHAASEAGPHEVPLPSETCSELRNSSATVRNSRGGQVSCIGRGDALPAVLRHNCLDHSLVRPSAPKPETISRPC